MLPGTDMEALAEENSRLRRELAATKGPKKPKRYRHLSFLATALCLTSLGVCLKLLVVWELSGNAKGHWTAADERTFPCYFVSQSKERNEPWDEWFVWKSDCSDCQSKAVGYERLGHTNKDKALAFMQMWKLKVCK